MARRAPGFQLLDLLGDDESSNTVRSDKWMTIQAKNKAAAKAKPDAQALARGAAPPRISKQPLNTAAHRASDDGGSKPYAEDYYRAFEHCYQDPKSGEVVLRFHKTNIVRINSQGHVLLTTGGWFTHTTLAAMNDALQAIDMLVTCHGQPASGHWIVADEQGCQYHYQDNIIIKATKPEHKNRGRIVLNAYHGGAEVPRYAYRQQPGTSSTQQQQQAQAAPARAAANGQQQQQPSVATSAGGAWGAAAPHRQQAAPAARPAGPSKPAHEQLAEAVAALGMQDEIDGGDDHVCVVCLDNPRDEVLVPCGHLVLCRHCCAGIIQSTNECPMCREVIVDHCTIDPNDA